MLRKALALGVAAVSLLAAQSVSAGTITVSKNGLTATATNTIVGVNSSATAAGGGDPRYFAQMPKFSGVTALIMDYGPGGRFICSGTLVSPTKIVTAAHCVTPAPGATLQSTTAYFYGGNNPDTVVSLNTTTATAVSVARYNINPLYTGEVIDQNDTAVLTLSTAAPSFATIYQIDFNDPVGKVFNVAGYGRRSDTGGSIGANLGTGRLRQGLNTYDFTFDDPAFQGFFTDRDPTTGENFFGTAEYGKSLVSDFDSGLAANDGSCLLSTVGFGNPSTPQFCNLGLGLDEVGIAGGDSGGPGFVNGKLASVNSYSLSFGSTFGDTFAGLNSSFGEFAGYVSLSSNKAFIQSALPEPSTWAMMLLGFGMIGTALRRRPRQVLRPAA